MSGLFAILKKSNLAVGLGEVSRISAALEYYGTDGQKTWKAGNVAVGIHHFRSKKQLPATNNFFAEKEEVVLILDGRLSNRRELCHRLDIDFPEKLDSSLDSKLALECYLRFGHGFASFLEGEFSAIVWDQRSRQLLAVRDLLGTRPLFFHLTDSYIAVATTLRAIVAASDRTLSLDKEFLGQLLAEKFQSAITRTPWKGVSRIPPSSFLTITESACKVKQYTDLRDQIDSSPPLRDEEQVEMFRDALYASVVDAAADTQEPVGIMVSGGLDSSSIASILRDACGTNATKNSAHLYSYQSTRFPSADERTYLASLASACAPFPLTTLDFDQMWALKDHESDEGFPLQEPDLMALRRPVLDTLRKAARDDCRVILHGNWADHILRSDATFSPHQFLYFASRRPLADLPGLIRDYHAPLFQTLLHGLFRPAVSAVLPRGLKSLLRKRREDFSVPEWLSLKFSEDTSATTNRAPRWDIRHAVVDSVLTGARQITVSNLAEIGAITGLQLRFPFLDQRVLRILLQANNRAYLDDGLTKPILRRALAKVLPEPIQSRKTNGVCDDLVNLGLREKERHRVEFLLRDPFTADLGLVEVEALRRAWTRYWNGNATEKWHLLAWLSVEYWVRGQQ